jgi:homopolymeric O-antigen transport system permease protein
MLVTPVVYTAERVLAGRPHWVAVVYGLNPMAGVVEGFRHALLGGAPPTALLASSAGVTLLLLASGLVVFRWLEPDFADRV